MHGVLPAVNRWFLSGLLVGAETRDLAKGGMDLPILLAAPEPLSGIYHLALKTLGLDNRVAVVTPGEMALAVVRGHRVLLALTPDPPDCAIGV